MRTGRWLRWSSAERPHVDTGDIERRPEEPTGRRAMVRAGARTHALRSWGASHRPGYSAGRVDRHARGLRRPEVQHGSPRAGAADAARQRRADEHDRLRLRPRPRVRENVRHASSERNPTVSHRERDEDVHGNDHPSAGRGGKASSRRHALPLPAGGVPGGQQITIRELLGHHSGLANYTDYTDWLARADRSTSTRPSDVLRFAASQPPTAPPNSGFQYSNTDYIALGLIIERITRQSLAQELEQRILRPLGLRNTQLATTRTPADLHDQGVNPNLPWAAGGIVSNAPDLARFFSALLSGRILSRGSLARMEQTIALGDGIHVADGLGIFSTRLRCGLVWGHPGGILDYTTLVDASQNGSRVAVISARGSARPPDLSTLLCPRHTTKTH